MTAKELKEELSKYDDDFLVLIPDPQSYLYIPVNNVAAGCNEADRVVFLDNFEEDED